MGCMPRLSAAFVCLLALATSAWAGPPCPPLDQSHSAWTQLLRRYVKDGSVDYSRWRAEGRAELDRYLRSLASTCRSEPERWSKEQKLAFWINAYNASMVKLVIDHLPIDSVRAIGAPPGDAFTRRFIPLGHLWKGGQEELSLDELEHDILRRELGDPRVHFALVCAARSCPALRSEAWQGARLGEQLDAAGRKFLRDPKRNRFDGKAKTLHLSSIFKWFREDFERGGRKLEDFVALYLEGEPKAALAAGEARLEFAEYDWSLNGS